MDFENKLNGKDYNVSSDICNPFQMKKEIRDLLFSKTQFNGKTLLSHILFFEIVMFSSCFKAFLFDSW